MSSKEQVRLEPCDIPAEKPKDPGYSLQKRDGEVVECDLCRLPVPTQHFSDKMGEARQEVDLCHICANLYHSSGLYHPRQYPDRTLLQDILMATRLIVREELARARRLPP